MNVFWKVFTDATTSGKAEIVLSHFTTAISVEYSDINIQPYQKSSYVCTFTIPLTSKQWSDVVLESLATMQLVGRSWTLSGDVASEIDDWSNDASISGVQNIHAFIDANA